MKKVPFAALVSCLALASAALTARGQVCETTFIPAIGIWQDDGNWTFGKPDAIPSNLKVGCIPIHKICNINSALSAAAAKAIIVDGKLVVEKGMRLTLHEDSSVNWDGVDQSVNGDLILRDAASLEIAGSLTVTGDGGEIRSDLQLYPVFDLPAVIVGPGVLTIDGVGTSREESLTIHGTLGIEAILFNDAYVVADDRELILRLNPKKGGTNGHWIADGDEDAILIVDKEVLYNGIWQIVEGAGTIQFNVVCKKLFADFEITTGNIEIHENLATSGNLDFRSVGGSAGLITVHSGALATFGN